MKQFSKFSLSILVMGLAVGCTHAKKAQIAEPAEGYMSVTPKSPSAEETEALAAILRGATLHFDYDEASLTTDSQKKLQLVAETLRTRPWAQVQIAGHCDERGTEEYNIVLGQRRAEVARLYLIALGIDGEAVETVSFGAEQPAQSGHDENAWAQNRRDVLSHQTTDSLGLADLSGW